MVDDEEPIRTLLEFNLRKAGFQALLAQNGAEAVEATRRDDPDVAILDVMLPDCDGFDLYRQITAVRPIPVLFLTARDSEVDRVLGLELGGDDYVTKPFSPRELVARVRAILRRAPRTEDEPQRVSFGEYQVDIDAHEVKRGGVTVPLTPKEFDLLVFMLRNKGKALARDELLDAVWGGDYFGDRRLIDVHIRHLREKLAIDPASPHWLQTVRGVGYRFEG
mgnify:CR=1 FL=1